MCDRTKWDGAARSQYGYVESDKANSSMWAGYVRIDPRYSPIDGFTFRNDLSGPVFSGNIFGSNRIFKSDSAAVTAERERDRSGAVHFEATSITLSAVTKQFVSIGAAVTNSRLYSAPVCAVATKCLRNRARRHPRRRFAGSWSSTSSKRTMPERRPVGTTNGEILRRRQPDWRMERTTGR